MDVLHDVYGDFTILTHQYYTLHLNFVFPPSQLKSMLSKVLNLHAANKAVGFFVRAVLVSLLLNTSQVSTHCRVCLGSGSLK